MDVAIVVATFGTSNWVDLAHRRAIPSAKAQDVPVIHRHGTTLAQARNEALAFVTSEFVIHLDADDELEEGYVEAMAKGSADLRAPAMRFVRNGEASTSALPQVVHHRHRCEAKCLLDGNWCCIGTAVRTDVAREVGGWREFPWCEDWDLWLRCHLAGATVEAIPAAVYRAWVRPQSRNQAPDRAAKIATHKAIVAANDDLLGCDNK